MMTIVETENFVVEAAERPHVDRRDGGHIRILPKKRVRDRTQLSIALANELVILTMIVGEAMQTALNKQGVDVGRINYQDNGNWGVLKPEGPYLHLHLYGRARSATTQRYGEALYLPSRETGFYAEFNPLDQADIQAIRSEIKRVSAMEKYRGRLLLNTRSL